MKNNLNNINNLDMELPFEKAWAALQPALDKEQEKRNKKQLTNNLTKGLFLLVFMCSSIALVDYSYKSKIESKNLKVEAKYSSAIRQFDNEFAESKVESKNQQVENEAQEFEADYIPFKENKDYKLATENITETSTANNIEIQKPSKQFNHKFKYGTSYQPTKTNDVIVTNNNSISNSSNNIEKENIVAQNSSTTIQSKTITNDKTTTKNNTTNQSSNNSTIKDTTKVDTTAIAKNNTTIKPLNNTNNKPNNKSTNQLHFGLQWNFAASKFINALDYNAHQNPLPMLVPQVYVTKKASKNNAVKLFINPLSQYYLNNQILSQTGNYQTTTLTATQINNGATTNTYHQTLSLNKLFSFEVGFGLQHSINKHFKLGANISANFVEQGIANNLIVMNNTITTKNNYYNINNKTANFESLNSIFMLGKIEAIYSIKKINIGVSISKPITNIMANQNASNPINTSILVGYNF